MEQEEYALIIPADVCKYLQNECHYSPEQIVSLNIALQKAPLKTYVRVNTSRISLDECQKRLQQLVDEQCREKEWNSEQFAVKPHAWIKDLLEIPVLSMVAMNREEHPRLAVMIDCHCGSAIMRGADIFAAGIMAASAGIQKGSRVAVYIDIDKRSRRGQQLLDSELLLSEWPGRLRHAGNGVAMMSRDGMVKGQTANGIRCASKNRGVAILMTEAKYQTPSLSSVLPGLIILQNLPSVLVGHLLAPQPGHRVLDMCAAPGGKTTHLASLMNDQGELIALDRSKERARRLAELCHGQFGFKCVEIHAGDSSKIRETNNSLFLQDESFDRILLDPSCSGIGKSNWSINDTIFAYCNFAGQRPIFRWDDKYSFDNLGGFGSYQRHLFNIAFKLLRPGGVLVFSTCTLNTNENESAVAWAMSGFKADGIELLDARQRLLPHLEPFENQSTSVAHDLGIFGCNSFLPEPLNKRVIKFDPVICRNTIGFFCAAFTKNRQISR